MLHKTGSCGKACREGFLLWEKENTLTDQDDDVNMPRNVWSSCLLAGSLSLTMASTFFRSGVTPCLL